MKKTNKKGFTIVELVIVIAVIAILSAVLIPTFANITEKAKKSSALQTARAALTNVIAEEGEAFGGNYTIKSGDYYFSVTNGQFDENSGKKTAPNAMTAAAVEKVFISDGADANNKFDIDADTNVTVLVDAVEISDLGNIVVYKLK